VDEDPTGTKALWDRGLLNGATQKAQSVGKFDNCGAIWKLPSLNEILEML